ncbi:MAG TPA: HlyD family efflux transporter periplasmic adaptor subunit [Terriglobia bacterium]|nr:HlyD family efflux transporter periplasmic adaptor subunit [Terriglobia bacterium]
MDIARPSQARKRRIRRIIYALIGVLVVVGTTVGLSHLKVAAPTVDAGTVWHDVVKRGPMVRDVRGIGTLVPEIIVWIPAVTDGQIIKRDVLPGAFVKPDTILVEMSDPILEQSLADSEYQVKAAQADYDSLKVKLETALLDQRSTAATVASQYHQDRLQAEVDEKLAADGLLSNLTLQLAQVKAQESATRNELEQKRLGVDAEDERAQLAAQQAKVDQLKALYNLKKSQVDQLRVKAGMNGVLQLLPVEVGQRVTAGTNLARVSDPTRLKAEIKIAETQAKDVAIGQQAEIDTHNGVIPGHVIRRDPSAVNGTVTVDVHLDGPLPQGAVPDLSVDGTITLERLADVLYVGRPAFGQPSSTITLFKYEPGERYADRVQVKLGRASVNNVEILGGLKVGDEVILSDMSRWDGVDRIKLE